MHDLGQIMKNEEAIARSAPTLDRITQLMETHFASSTPPRRLEANVKTYPLDPYQRMCAESPRRRRTQLHHCSRSDSQFPVVALRRTVEDRLPGLTILGLTPDSRLKGTRSITSGLPVICGRPAVTALDRRLHGKDGAEASLALRDALISLGSFGQWIRFDNRFHFSFGDVVQSFIEILGTVLLAANDLSWR